MLGLRGANASEVVNGIRAKLVELAPGMPPGVTVEVFYDRGKLVERAVGTVIIIIVFLPRRSRTRLSTGCCNASVSAASPACRSVATAAPSTHSAPPNRSPAGAAKC